MRCDFLKLTFILTLALSPELLATEASTTIKDSDIVVTERRDLGLFFVPEENGITFTRQSVDYDASLGNVLKVGPVNLYANTVDMKLTREEGWVDEVQFGLESIRRKVPLYALSFKWPLEYLSDGVIEIIDDDSVSHWRMKISDQQIWQWQNRIQSAKNAENKTQSANKNEADLESDAQLKASGAKLLLSRDHWHSHLGLVGAQMLAIPIWHLAKPFRFCVTNETAEGRIAVCSRRYQVVRNRKWLYLDAVSGTVRPRVYINDRPVSLKGSALFADDKQKIKFSSLLSDGTYFEFVSLPKAVVIVDVARVDGGTQVTGYGAFPMAENVEHIQRYEQDIWDFMNFMPTIGDFRQFWRTTLPPGQQDIYIQGEAGVPFKITMLYEDLPSAASRPFISEKSPTSTYSRKITLTGRVAEDVDVSSSEVSAQKTGAEEFEWKFLTHKPHGLSRSYLLVHEKSTSKTWKAGYEMHRAYGREISVRTTGVVTNAFALLLLGEIATQWWFDSVLGWENTILAQQRWGLAARYFQAFAGLGPKEEGQDIIKLSVANLDLKYRLSPGTWGRDPTLGLMMAVQQLNLEEFQGQMLGVGAFWARSMPRLFDDFLNKLPWMNYPKWVDVEFVYYPLPLTSRNHLLLNFAWNFHGKIKWTPRFYGEAGFGVKYFNFRDYVEASRVALGLVYGTAGLGYEF